MFNVRTVACIICIVHTDCRLFFVDAATQADVDVSTPSTATSWTCGACCHAGDEQLQRLVVRPYRRTATVRPAAAVCYKRIDVDRAGTRNTMCCCFRTAPTAFIWTCQRTARRSRSPLWNTTAGDWCSATAGPERRAARRQRLCENGTAAASLTICGLIRTVSADLANDGDRAGRRLLNFMHIVCNESNWTWWVHIILFVLT